MKHIKAGSDLDKAALYFKLKGIQMAQPRAENETSAPDNNSRVRLNREAHAIAVQASILAKGARELAMSVVRYTDEHSDRNGQSGPPRLSLEALPEASEGPDPHEEI
jgi:hypothetical protein